MIEAGGEQWWRADAGGGGGGGEEEEKMRFFPLPPLRVGRRRGWRLVHENAVKCNTENSLSTRLGEFNYQQDPKA